MAEGVAASRPAGIAADSRCRRLDGKADALAAAVRDNGGDRQALHCCLGGDGDVSEATLQAHGNAPSFLGPQASTSAKSTTVVPQPLDPMYQTPPRTAQTVAAEASAHSRSVHERPRALRDQPRCVAPTPACPGDGSAQATD